MKIIIATDSFKGCSTSAEAASAFETGIRRVVPDAEIVKIPVADGGEGTVDAVMGCLPGERVRVSVSGPLGEKVIADYGIVNSSTAIIEMAAASGLTLVPEDKRDPMHSSTFGTGELIKDALSRRCKKILIGIGGSATNDGGMGMAMALGVSFIDKTGKVLNYPSELHLLEKIDMKNIDTRLGGCEIIVLCDVTNPLTGPGGATYVYGPQKGVNSSMLPILDANLKHFAMVIRDQLGIDISDIPGSGAAGGLGGGLIAFGKARLQRGIETVLELCGMEKHLAGADLVITGEGRIDGQTAEGKVPCGVAKLALKYNVPVIAFAGAIGDGADKIYECGITSMMCIADAPMTADESIMNFKTLAPSAAERMIRMVLALKSR